MRAAMHAERLFSLFGHTVSYFSHLLVVAVECSPCYPSRYTYLLFIWENN